jgi:hypothetical protein
MAGFSSLLPAIAAAQSGCPQPPRVPRAVDPPGKDMFIPYVATPGLAHEKELQNVEQVKILAEINKLTVELVKRRSDRNALPADTPQLVKKLKDLAKKLRDEQ